MRRGGRGKGKGGKEGIGRGERKPEISKVTLDLVQLSTCQLSTGNHDNVTLS